MPKSSEALCLSGKGIGNTVSSNDLSANGTGWKVNRHDTPGTVFTEHVSTEKFPPTIWQRVAYFALHHPGFLKFAFVICSDPIRPHPQCLKRSHLVNCTICWPHVGFLTLVPIAPASELPEGAPVETRYLRNAARLPCIDWKSLPCVTSTMTWSPPADLCLGRRYAYSFWNLAQVRRVRLRNSQADQSYR